LIKTEEDLGEENAALGLKTSPSQTGNSKVPDKEFIRKSDLMIQW